MATIVTVTINPVVDKSCSVDQVAPERKLRCSAPNHDPGGGGINVARAIRLLGGEAVAFWTRGGTTGERLAQLLDGEQIPHHAIPIGDATRENLIVFETSTHLQYRFGMPGPELSEEEIQRCLQRVREAHEHPDYLVLSGSLPPGAPDDLYARFAQQAGGVCRVVLDASGPALQHGFNSGVYMIKPNLRELGQLAGEPVETDGEIERTARGLIDAGKAEVVVVTIGSGGAILVTGEGAEKLRVPTVPIRSKVGAGDSTVAGIVLALVRALPLREAVRFGLAAGAAAVMTEGTALCRREDTERLYQEMNHIQR